MIETVAIAHDSAHFNWADGDRQGEFKANHFTWLEFAGKGTPDSVSAKFSRSAPKRFNGTVAKDLQAQARVNGETGKTAPFAGISLALRRTDVQACLSTERVR